MYAVAAVNAVVPAVIIKEDAEELPSLMYTIVTPDKRAAFELTGVNTTRGLLAYAIL